MAKRGQGQTMTREERWAAIDDAKMLLARGENPTIIRKHLCEQFNCHRNTASRILKMVWADWRRQFAGDRKKHVTFALAQRNELIKKAWEDKDWSTAARIADSRDKIIGIMGDNNYDELVAKLHRFLGVVVGVLNDHLQDDPARRKRVIDAVWSAANTYEVPRVIESEPKDDLRGDLPKVT